MSIEDRAKAAAQARQELHATLLACAGVLNEAATAMATSAAELERAAEREAAATSDYVSELERQLHQRALN